jgi:hypothetical protein
MTYLHLNVSKFTWETRQADPYVRYDRADTVTQWDVHGISLSDKDGEYALPVDFPVQVGDKVYVVYAIYSSGDTFHRDVSSNFEVISFHKNYDIAMKNQEALQELHKNAQMQIEYDSGAVVKRYCPWDGYFESLDNVIVEVYTVD